MADALLEPADVFVGLSRRRLTVSIITICAAPLIVALLAVPLLWSVHEWNLPRWLVALIGSLSCGALLYVAWRFAQAVVEQRFRFSLRTMFWTVAAAAVLLGMCGRWWLKLIGQHLSFNSVAVYGAHFGSARLSSTGNLLDRWIGYDPFETEHDLWFTSDRAVAEALEHPEKFPNITQLSFDRGITSQAFTQPARLNDFPQARYTQFIDSKIDDEALRAIAQWKSLNDVFFNSCVGVTDRGIAELIKLPKLEGLSFVAERAVMTLSDAALAHVGSMKSLRRLSLLDLPQLTDAGFLQLHGLENLEELSIRNTGLTSAGLQQLYNALPDCRILVDDEVDGPQNIREIDVRLIGKPDAREIKVADPAQIATILKFIKSITDQPLFIRQPEKPSAATYELTFQGRTRPLYQALFDNTTFQETYQTIWNHWRISEGHAAKLKKVLGLPNN